MPITLKHAIVCDDVRVENNGKFIIIGMYTPDLSVPQIPFVVPTLTFVMWLESNTIGNIRFTATLSHLESGSVVAQAMGGMQIARPSPFVGIAPIRFPGIQFASQGSYVFGLQIEGQAEPLTHTFSVILLVPVVQRIGGIPGMPGMPPNV